MERGTDTDFRIEELLALLSIKGVGPQTVVRLIKACKNIHDTLDLSLIQFKDITQSRNAESAYNEWQANHENYLSQATYKIDSWNEKGIKVVAVNSKMYPTRYLSLKDAPLLLYYKGNADLFNWQHSIAVIGTRECSETGFNIGQKTASYFASRNFNIVSGLAIGIDTSAHIGALKVKGYTTGILVDVEKIYPKENRKLAAEILDSNGLLFSESEPGGFINKNMFVLRDRLQSALSDAVFPIETDIKGGTMHTVGYSRDYKKPLYCPNLSDVKGYDISFSKAQGILHLIRSGIAEPYTGLSYQSIYERLAGPSEIETPKPQETNFIVDVNTHNSLLFDIEKYTDHNNPQVSEKKKKARKQKKIKPDGINNSLHDQNLDLQ